MPLRGLHKSQARAKNWTAGVSNAHQRAAEQCLCSNNILIPRVSVRSAASLAPAVGPSWSGASAEFSARTNERGIVAQDDDPCGPIMGGHPGSMDLHRRVGHPKVEPRGWAARNGLMAQAALERLFQPMIAEAITQTKKHLGRCSIMRLVALIRCT